VQDVAVLLVLVATFNGPLVVETVKVAIDFIRDLWSQWLLNKALTLKLAATKALVENVVDHCKEPVTLLTFIKPLMLNCGHILDSESYGCMLCGFNPRCPVCMAMQQTNKCFALSGVVEAEDYAWSSLKALMTK
jgi:hypothetical protein